MARQKREKPTPDNASGANVGYEAQLWQMADALRGSMDAAEYKHVVLGLIFLKYISDAGRSPIGRVGDRVTVSLSLKKYSSRSVFS